MPRSVIYVPAAAAPLALGLLLAMPEPAAAQSFNCRYAHYIDEAAICQDQALGRLDNELNSLFNNTMRRLPPEAQRRLDQAEDAWVAERRRCGADPRCLTQAYQNRRHQLEGMTATRDERQPAVPPPGFPVPPPPFPGFAGGGPVVSGPGFPPPPPGFRPATKSVEERDTRAPQIGLDMQAPQNELQREGSAVPLSRTTTATTTETTETGATPEHAGAAASEPFTTHKSTRKEKTKTSHAPNRSSQPVDATAGAAQSEPHEAVAKPVDKSPAPTAHDETHAVAGTKPEPASGSSQAPPAAKPVIRWVDPPPSQ